MNQFNMSNRVKQCFQRPIAVLVFTVLWCCSTGVSAGDLYFVHSDHLNTPQVITDANQQVVWEARKLPFGETDIVTSDISYNIRFPGQYYDQESGLHYNYFRDYDPSLGRYVQSDPIGLDGGTNTYAYVSGNPLKYTDPLGLTEKCTTILKLPFYDVQACTEDGKQDETKKKGKQKREKRQIDDICKDYKLDRNEFGDFLEHEYKPDNGIRGGDTMSYGQLKDAAEQFLGM